MSTCLLFRPIAVGATVATAIACGFLIAAIVSYSSTNLPSKVTHTPIDVKSFALAFGTILFSFGGASAFPTIQHDMGVTTDFPRAVFLGFAGIYWELQFTQELSSINYMTELVYVLLS